MAFPIAVQLYSVRDEAKQDMFNTLKKLKEMGYEGVEFAGIFDYSVKEIKRMCSELGLVPISAHVPFKDMLRHADGLLEQYEDIGCKYVAIPYLVEEHRPGTENFAQVIENFKMVSRVAKEHGMQMLYHNHDFEFVKIDGKYALDIIYEEVSDELLKTELDTCWVNVGGEDPASYIRKYAGRSPVVHLKDFVGSKSENMYELIGIEKKAQEKDDKFELRAVGYGVQNFPEILKACKEAGTEWVVVEIDTPPAGQTAMEAVKASIDYLKTINN